MRVLRWAKSSLAWHCAKQHRRTTITRSASVLAIAAVGFLASAGSSRTESNGAYGGTELIGLPHCLNSHGV